MDQSTLFAGTSVTEITPPLIVGLLTSSVKGLYEPFESVRLPLYARVLVLKSATEAVAIVSMDLLTLSDTSVGGWDRFKKGMAGVIPAEKIVICYTHTHSAPESGGITDLYLTAEFKDWIAEIQLKIKNAIASALAKLSPCSATLASSILEGYSLQRRIKTAEGIIMSDSIQPIAPDLMTMEPVDRRVKSLCLKNLKGEGIATVVHAVCHPVHEMCIPQVSSEFPGEMCDELEKTSASGTALFLNGAAGDTNPPTVSMGPTYAHEHGAALAKLVLEQEDREVLETSFAFGRKNIPLQIRAGAKIDNQLDALARLSAVKIGDLAIVFLPGEPFIEVALAIEKSSPFTNTIVVGFSENTIGYIPTTAAFEEGGYEIGPGKWSYLGTESDKLVKIKAVQLLEELYDA